MATMRQIIRAIRVGLTGGAPEVEFIAIRTPRVRVDGPIQNDIITLTYAAVMAVNTALGNQFFVTPTDGVAFAFSVPSPAPGTGFGQRLGITIINTFGVLGAATFTAGAGGFRLGAAWTQPANGFSRTIQFEWTGTVWKEVSRTATDVAN